MEESFAIKSGGVTWIGMNTMAEAKPVKSGKPLVLLYGPDNILKAAAASLRSQLPDCDVNLRATDIDPGMADITECQRRIVITSARSDMWHAIYLQHNFKTESAEWRGTELKLGSPGVVESPKGPSSEAVAPPAGKRLVLQDGTSVDHDISMKRGADNLGVTVAILDAMDESTRMVAIHAAYDLKYDPPARVSVPVAKPSPAKVKKVS
jgi:hypothetical protein